jgi:hypothetical protein
MEICIVLHAMEALMPCILHVRIPTITSHRNIRAPKRLRLSEAVAIVIMIQEEREPQVNLLKCMAGQILKEVSDAGPATHPYPQQQLPGLMHIHGPIPIKSIECSRD